MWHLNDHSQVVLMLLLTSSLVLVRDTFEKRNVKDLELQAMPIIHLCYYTMGKTIKQENSFQWGENQNFIIIKNNNKNGRNILSIPSLVRATSSAYSTFWNYELAGEKNIFQMFLCLSLVFTSSCFIQRGYSREINDIPSMISEENYWLCKYKRQTSTGEIAQDKTQTSQKLVCSSDLWLWLKPTSLRKILWNHGWWKL